LSKLLSHPTRRAADRRRWVGRKLFSRAQLGTKYPVPNINYLSLRPLWAFVAEHKTNAAQRPGKQTDNGQRTKSYTAT
jgi:hypothetical protein